VSAPGSLHPTVSLDSLSVTLTHEWPKNPGGCARQIVWGELFIAGLAGLALFLTAGGGLIAIFLSWFTVAAIGLGIWYQAAWPTHHWRMTMSPTGITYVDKDLEPRNQTDEFIPTARIVRVALELDHRDEQHFIRVYLRDPETNMAFGCGKQPREDVKWLVRQMIARYQPDDEDLKLAQDAQEQSKRMADRSTERDPG